MDKIKTKNKKEYDGPELIPPQGDPDVGTRVFSIFAEIINDKIDLGLHDEWNRNNELLHNKHWRNKSLAAVPLVSANLIFVHIQRTTNELTDNNPTFNVARIGENEDGDNYTQDQFEDLQHTACHWWTEQEQQDVFDTTVRNGELNGIGIEKTIFNPDAESNLGEVETVNVDPFHFGWYPVKLKDPRLLQKSEAVLHFYPMSIREAKRRWPDSAEKIKSDSETFKELGDERREISGQDSAKEKSLMLSIASTVKELLNYLTGSTTASDEILIIECWTHDYSKKKNVKKVSKPAEIEGEEPTEEEIEESDPTYPGNIRLVTVCNNGKVVLEDRKNPCINWSLPEEEYKKSYLYNKFPFSACNSVKDTTSAWGSSDIRQLEWLNIELDKAISQLVLYKDTAARLKIINPLDSGVEDDDFDNYPSVIRPINATVSQGIRYLEVPPSPMDYPAAIQLFKDMFFLVAGTFEMDQAQTQGKNVLAYKAIAALLERAATMRRGKTRSYSRMIRERGRMFISHVQNFYTEDRWITYKDKGGQELSKKINGEKLRIPAKLTVVTGSTLPVSKVQQREEALALFSAHAIDQPDLLDKIEWPDRTEVIQRMKEGPLGEAMKKLEMIGVPGDLLAIFTKAIMADPKKLQQALEKGQFPQFATIFKAMINDAMQGQGVDINEGQQQDPMANAEVNLKAAETQKVVAEIDKVKAETLLTVEKIGTEKVEQQVRAAGIGFDQETLTMERAKTIKEIESANKQNELARVSAIKDVTTAVHGMKMGEQAVSMQNNKPGYNEKGLLSNNKET
jgi:hypothetical protein